MSPVRLRGPSAVTLIAMQIFGQCVTRASAVVHARYACGTLCTTGSTDSTGNPSNLGPAAFIRTEYSTSTSRTSRRDPTPCSECAGTGRVLIALKGDQQEILTSTKSSTVKLFKSLASKKRRRIDENATIIEGQRLVFDVLSDASTNHLVRRIILEESALHDKNMLAMLQHLASNSPNVDISFATKEVTRACSDTVTPQGVVAIASLPPPYDARRRDGNGAVDQKTSSLYLILDGVSDPGNVGTLFRSALACGVEAVILMPGSCDVFNPKTVRSSMGATFKMPLLHVDGWDGCKKVLTEFGVKLDRDFYAATMEGSEANNECDAGMVSSSYYDVNWTGRTSGGGQSQTRTSMAVCIGKEGLGLSEEVRDAVRNGEIRAVHVPMEQAIESLNAAVCGSVILFEAARQIKTKKQ